MNVLTKEDGKNPPLLVIPGLSNSGPGHWQTVLEQTHANSRRVVQENWDSPKLEPWLARLYQSIEDMPGAVLVAHSLGCILVAHAATAKSDLAISGAMLVAPADIEHCGQLLPDLPGFAPIPKRRFKFPSVVVGSRNDPYISLDRARYLAARWGARFVDVGNSGHINTASGHGDWPEGEEILSSLTSGENGIAHPAATLRKYG